MVCLLMYLFAYKNIGITERFYGFYYNYLVFFSFIFNFIYLFKRRIRVKKSKKIFGILIMIIFIYLISLIVNSVNINENNPIKNMVLNLILDFNFCLFLIIYVKKRRKNNNTIFKGFILASFIDIIFSILRFNIGTIDDFFRKIYPVNNLTLAFLLESKLRLIGFGGFFFSGGITISISLILIIYLFLIKYIKKKEKIIYFFIYIFQALIGILISRTTIIGIIISILYLCLNIKNERKLLKLCFFTFIIFLIVLIIYINLNKSLQLWINTFVFEYGKSSLKDLITMYETFPSSLKTILIGDALWTNNLGYYMSIDIGYLRMIFFNGIIGLLFQILFNYYLTKIKNQKLKKLANILFILYLVLNLKGYISYIPICFLIYLMEIIKLEESNNEKIKYNNSSI